MAQYIDKSALVAEIERKIKEGEAVVENVPSSAILGLIQAYKNVISFLDTIEVKEVDEEPVSNDLEAEFVIYLKHKFNIPQEGNKLKTNGWNPSPYDLLDIAKHFFELGLKAQKGE